MVRNDPMVSNQNAGEPEPCCLSKGRMKVPDGRVDLGRIDVVGDTRLRI
jgi:hypothetical protein